MVPTAQFLQLIYSLNLGQFGPTTSAQLISVISDETGTGVLVFGTSPSFTTDIRPASDDGATLGTASLRWSDLFLAEGGVINWDAGDVTITQTGNVLAFAGASTGYTFDAAVAPATNDGAALGSTTLQWSDLFLAEGAVINWDNGDATLTQSGNMLTLAGADLTVPNLTVTTNVTVGEALVPDANDGAALGTTALQFSDLFLAEGAVINWDNGDVTLTQSGNSLTVAGGNLIFPGTATNDSAAAGNVGEVVTATLAAGSATSLTTNTAKTITSMSLTAGDWDLTGFVTYVQAGTTVLTTCLSSISQTDNTRDSTNEGVLSFGGSGITGGSNPTGFTPVVRKQLSATTTIYLIGQASFTTSTCSAWGTIRARRMR